MLILKNGKFKINVKTIDVIITNGNIDITGTLEIRTNNVNEKDEPKDDKLPDLISCSGKVEFKNVFFSYSPKYFAHFSQLRFD